MSQAVYCGNCGYKSSSVSSLTGSTCPRHPDGPGKGRHVLYEGTEKKQYACKYCGYKSSSISSLTGSTCPRHPAGHGGGKHAAAL